MQAAKNPSRRNSFSNLPANLANGENFAEPRRLKGKLARPDCKNAGYRKIKPRKRWGSVFEELMRGLQEGEPDSSPQLLFDSARLANQNPIED